MNTKLFVAVVTALALFVTSSAWASTREEKRVADAADVLDQLSRIPEKSIPPNLLSRAYAVAVIPNVVKAAFGLGARRGKGLLVVRQDDNSWSHPAFITLTGGSFGWQIGAESADVILVFKTRKGVDGIANGKLTLGADASVAAGPVGRQDRKPGQQIDDLPDHLPVHIRQPVPPPLVFEGQPFVVDAQQVK